MASIPNRLAGALAVLVLALGAVIGLAAAPAAAATHAVVIKQYAYTPASLTIAQGDTVTWTNQDTVEHDVMVTSGPEHFHSPMLAKGQSWSHTFTGAGSYSYLCSVHPDMKASVTVRAKATPTKAATQQASVAPLAPAAPVTTPTAAAHTTHPAASPSATAPAAPAAGPAASGTIPATVTTGSEATLDPLLIVAGAAAAVMVFCLLLLSSRPAKQPAEIAEEPEPVE